MNSLSKIKNTKFSNISARFGGSPIKLSSGDNNFIKFFLAKPDPIVHNRVEHTLLFRAFLITVLLFIMHLPLFWFFSLSSDWLPINFTTLKFNGENISLLSPTSFLALTGTIFWNLRSKFSDQWSYCADMYNKIFLEQLEHIKSSDLLLYKKVTLSLDLISLNLWTNKSFKKLFNYCLDEAIEHDAEKAKPVNNEFSLEGIYKKFESGEATKKDASALLGELQNHLELKIHLKALENALDPAA